jgi:putative MATE family efflux protein
MASASRAPLRTGLTTDPVGRTLINLTLPAVGGVLAIMMSSIVDTWAAGHMGVMEQAAIAFAFPVVYGLTSLALGLAVGSAAATARMLGAGEIARARRFVAHAIALGTTVVSLAALLFWAVRGTVFDGLGVTPQIQPLLTAYLGPWLLAAPCVASQMIGNSILRASGDMVASSLNLVALAVVKIVLTPLFVFELGAGLAGAGWASCASMAVASLLSFWVLIQRKGLLSLDGLTRNELLENWRRVLVVGLPSSLTNILIPISNGVAVKVLASQGPAVIAGFGVATRLEALALIPTLALSGVIGIFVGQNLGARQGQRMIEAMRLCVGFCLGYGLLIAGVLALVAPWLSGLMASAPETIEASTLYLRLVGFTFGFYGVLMIVAGGFNGCGDPRPNLALYGAKSLLFFIPGVIMGAELGGYLGACIGIAVANILSGVCAYIWFRSQFRHKLPDPV